MPYQQNLKKKIYKFADIFTNITTIYYSSRKGRKLFQKIAARFCYWYYAFWLALKRCARSDFMEILFKYTQPCINSNFFSFVDNIMMRVYGQT